MRMADSVGQYLDEIGLVPLLTADDERLLSQQIERGRWAEELLEARNDRHSRDEAVEVASEILGQSAVHEIVDIEEDEAPPARITVVPSELATAGVINLRREVRAGAKAKDKFIRANLRLVVSGARRYPLPSSMELLDLIQEGNLGLEHAVDKFDWRKGFKFSTYGTFWIRQAIGRALDQKASLVRLPGDRSASLRAALREVGGDGDELDDEHARLHRISTPTSLDRHIGDDEKTELVDLIPDGAMGPDDEVMVRAGETMARGLLDVLDPRARYAVEQRFGLNDGRKRSYREVGEDLGVTAEAARRLVKRAITAVRNEAGDMGADFGAA